MKRIAIIGGGISGMSAAFVFEKQRRASAPVHYVLYQSTARLGGVIVTEHVDGCVVEAGPDSFLTEKPWAADLCRQIGLSDQLIGSNDAARKTYILVNHRLVSIPDGLMFMVPTRILSSALSPLFSIRTKLRIAREWFHPPSQVATDETVAAFVERHYGAELVDRLADPLLSGVYGGDASSLSVRAVLPRFVEMERTHGSLGHAMLSARKKIPQSSYAPPLFTSLKGGMQEMVDALAARLEPSALRLNTPVQNIQSENDGWTVSAGQQSDFYDAVIIAVPAMVAAKLLRIRHPKLASELAGVPYSSSVTVTLGYDRRARQSLPPGFGFLIPHIEGKRMIAATFVHNKFPYRAPEDRALVRCFLGGSRDEPILELTDNEILRIVREELRQILGIAAEPLFSRVYKWKGAMAQYNVGHLERLERIERLCQQLPVLALAGNGYRGIGVPDCVRSGKEAAERVLAEVGLTSRRPAVNEHETI
jgi:oxygen-dependent protoporphyrinogen oxidase